MKDDIYFIKQIMAESRKVIINNSIYYIVLGIFIPIGTLASYIFGYNNKQQYIPFLWLILSIIIWIILFILGMKKEKEEKIKTKFHHIFGLLYLGLGSLFLIIIFLFIYTQMISLKVISSLMCLLIAYAYYISAVFNNFKWIYIFSCIWMLGGVLVIFLPELWGPCINAFLSIILGLIPGIWIYKNKENLNIE